MMRESLIVSDPDILGGKPIVRGTRISVALILQCLASGMTREEILRGYPTLTEEGLDSALDYAARQFQGEEVRFYDQGGTSAMSSPGLHGLKNPYL